MEAGVPGHLGVYVVPNVVEGYKRDTGSAMTHFLLPMEIIAQGITLNGECVIDKTVMVTIYSYR